MALDDFAESEVAVAVAATAAVLSAPVRKLLRRGAVYGLAGVLIAGATVSALGKGVGRGVGQAVPGGARTDAGEATPGAEGGAP
jgi:hypothetical protein